MSLFYGPDVCVCVCVSGADTGMPGEFYYHPDKHLILYALYNFVVFSNQCVSHDEDPWQSARRTISSSRPDLLATLILQVHSSNLPPPSHT